jgi:mannose-6-phosphate isomerase-like protein (cupin superfamily)
VPDGFVLPSDGGDRLGAGGLGVTLKAGARHAAAASTFEAVVGPGFDVGAHLHEAAEEFFYVLEGQIDLLAFEPSDRREANWRLWESRDGGRRVIRGGPGSFMFVPAGCPHAFANPGPEPARLLFQASPAGHEIYLEELGDLMRSGPRGPEAVAELRRRHGIEQLTAMGAYRP